MRYTREIIEPHLASSESFSDLLRRMGKHTFHASATVTVKNALNRLGLDYSHFKGRHWAKGITSNKLIPWKERLVLRPEGSGRLRTPLLKKALLSSGRKYVCEKCKREPVWQDMPLTLQIDHENGIVWDDRPSNLRFICPNCHSQTVNYGCKNYKD